MQSIFRADQSASVPAILCEDFEIQFISSAMVVKPLLVISFMTFLLMRFGGKIITKNYKYLKSKINIRYKELY